MTWTFSDHGGAGSRLVLNEPHSPERARSYAISEGLASAKSPISCRSVTASSARTELRILEKMGIRTNAELTYYAVQSKLTV